MTVAGDSSIEADAVRAALERLLSSRTFARSTQLRRFMQYTVERTLEGRAEDIKEYAIAVDVFGRRASHDPTIDPIVRTEARRLRKKLEAYYEGEGSDEPLRIDYPKGGYVPRFVRPSPAPLVPRGRLARPLVAVGVVVLAALVALLTWRAPNEAPAESTESSPLRVVVLPFEDLSPEEDNEHFALAVSESISTRLATVAGLTVVGRASVARLGTDPMSTSALAALLRADYVVQGSVVRDGDACRVAAQVIRARDDIQTWAEEFDFEWSDIFPIQDSVSQRLADQLRTTASSVAPPPTTNLEAYEEYFKGRYHSVNFTHALRNVDFAEARKHLLRTVELDPQMADAWAELGHLHLVHLYPPTENRSDDLDQAETYLTQALSIDPGNARALHTLGAVRASAYRHVEGVELLQQSIESNPSDSRAYDLLGQVYAWLGFYESALAEYERAVELDPLLLTAYAWKGRELRRLGQFEEALATIGQVKELAPGSHAALLVGNVYYAMGRLEQAEAVWNDAYSRLPKNHQTSFYEIALALVATKKGDLEEGRRILEKNRGLLYRDQDHLSEIAALLGETAYVVERIEGHPQRSYRWLIENPSLARLVGEPAFDELTRNLHERWLSDLEALRDSLPVQPPELPDPEAYRVRVTNR